MSEEGGITKAYASAAVSDRMAKRQADDSASFLLPHLRPGLSLVDVGCGPGSITLGLATAVAPGDVLGIDIEAAQVQRATALAAEQGVTNARFEAGTAYELPLADDSVDVVFAHTLLVYLNDPVRALREFRRVLAPNGLVAIRERDLGTRIVEPPSPALEAAASLIEKYQAISRGQYIGRNMRTILVQAGFARTEAWAVAENWVPGTVVSLFENLLRTDAYRAAAKQHGWPAGADVDELGVEMHAWAALPDAFFANFAFAALGWQN
jgi:ubiquinone/menaquinone biosynthesis C-methylase UbiE